MGLAGLMPKLLELIDARISRQLDFQEKSKLEREEVLSLRDLEKAKQANAFPTTVDMLQADAKACQSRLSKINRDITRQEDRSTEITENIGGWLQQMLKLATNSPSSAFVDKASGMDQNVVKLEDDVRKIKRTILIKKEQDLPDKPIDISKVCNTVESQSRAHIGFRKSINALEEWKTATDDELKQAMAAEKPQSQVQASLHQAINTVTDQAQNFAKSLSALEDRLKAIEQAVSQHEASVNELSAEQKKMQVASASKEDQMQDHLTAQGQVFPKVLREKFDAISERIDSLSDSHQEQRSSSELYNGLSNQMSNLNRDLGKMKENWDDLLRRVPYLSEASQEVKKHVKSYDSLATSLRSLENRWNNINTDSLVKQMAQAMQEMYPSARQLTEEVSTLKNHVNQGIPELRTDVKEHLGKITQLQTELKNLHDAFDTQTNKCLDNASKSDKYNEASTSQLTELKSELQDLKAQSETTIKSICDLGTRQPIERTSQSSSAEPIDKAVVQALCDDMKALLEKGKRDMIDLLAEVNGIIAPQPEIPADESNKPNQDLSQELEFFPANESSHRPRGLGSIVQPPLDHLPQSIAEGPLHRSLARPQHSQISPTSQVHPKSATFQGNKRPREVNSDDDSPPPSTTGTTSQPSAPSSNPGSTIGKKAKKKKKKKARERNFFNEI